MVARSVCLDSNGKGVAKVAEILRTNLKLPVKQETLLEATLQQ